MKKVILLILIVLLLPGCAWKFSASGVETPSGSIDSVEAGGEVKPPEKEKPE
jgi:hypothetical protein